MKRGLCWIWLCVWVACSGQECVSRRLFWSPDGRQLAVVTDQGLCLADAEGKLSQTPPIASRLVGWLPDSRRLVAVLHQPADTWEKAAAGLPNDRRQALLALADRLREEALAHQEQDWNKFQPKVAEELTDGELAALLLYVRDHRGEGLAAKLGNKKWEELKKLTVTLQVVRVYEVIGGKLNAGTVLGTTVNAINEVRISPDGKTAALVETIRGGKARWRLVVTSVAGGGWRTVAEQTAIWPDWSADGQFLVYAGSGQTGNGHSLQLGTLSRRRVCDGSGALLGSFSDPEDLVGLLFFPQLKVRCLRDGRILFSSAEVALPSTQRDMPQRISLFAVDPGRQPGVIRLIPRDAEAELPRSVDWGLFELSPDQTRVALAGGESDEDGSISLLTLATGEVTSVVRGVKGMKAHQVPAWRTDGELSFIVPAGGPGGSPAQTAVVLWSADGRTRCLSCDWPMHIDAQETEVK